MGKGVVVDSHFYSGSCWISIVSTAWLDLASGLFIPYLEWSECQNPGSRCKLHSPFPHSTVLPWCLPFSIRVSLHSVSQKTVSDFLSLEERKTLDLRRNRGSWRQGSIYRLENSMIDRILCNFLLSCPETTKLQRSGKLSQADLYRRCEAERLSQRGQSYICKVCQTCSRNHMERRRNGIFLFSCTV